MSALQQFDKSVVKQVSDELNHYVYILVDPATGIPFYVGKGHGIRHGAHLGEVVGTEGPEDEVSIEESRKKARIWEILSRPDRAEPEVWILRHGLEKSDYTQVEAAAIDLLMSFPLAPTRSRSGRVPLHAREQLTNERRELAKGHGVRTLLSILEEFGAPELETTEPLLIIRLGSWREDPEVVAGEKRRDGWGYKDAWLTSAERVAAFSEIGLSASAWWRIDPAAVAAANIRHVAVVHRGVTRALLRIDPDSWEPRTIDGKTYRGFQFTVVDRGSLFDEVVGAYGHRLPPADAQREAVNGALLAEAPAGVAVFCRRRWSLPHASFREARTTGVPR